MSHIFSFWYILHRAFPFKGALSPSEPLQFVFFFGLIFGDHYLTIFFLVLFYSISIHCPFLFFLEGKRPFQPTKAPF